jgi:hypothetical protein
MRCFAGRGGINLPLLGGVGLTCLSCHYPRLWAGSAYGRHARNVRFDRLQSRKHSRLGRIDHPSVPPITARHDGCGRGGTDLYSVPLPAALGG